VIGSESNLCSSASSDKGAVNYLGGFRQCVAVFRCREQNCHTDSFTRHFELLVLHIILQKSAILVVIAFSRNQRTHPKFVSQAREIEIFCEDCKSARPSRFFQGLLASFSCPSATSCLFFFVASFVVFNVLGFSLNWLKVGFSVAPPHFPRNLHVFPPPP